MAAGPEIEGGRTIAVLRQQLAAAVAERDEAQARQAALAEVLEAINASSAEPKVVFDMIIGKAMALCDAPSGGLVSVDGDYASALAFRDAPKALTDYWGAPQYIDPDTGMGQVLRQGRTIHHADMAASEPYKNRAPVTVSGVELGGIRSHIMVPLVNERGVIGIFVIWRYEVRPFSNRQIALVEAFAAQAMLAMENARLFAEQCEALEQQTATTEVLEVINASPGDLAPVFGAMLEKAMRLCEAAFGVFGRFDGKVFQVVADRGLPAGLVDAVRQIQSPPPHSALGRIAAGESVVQIVDLADTEIYRSGFVGATALVDIGGTRTALFVALRKEGAPVGVFVFYRREVRAFSPKQIALLQNFAAQAVIAMENARLLTEQREALEQQTATADILRVISQSPTDVAPVLDVVADSARRFCGADDVVVGLRNADELVVAAHVGLIPSPPSRRLDRSTSQGRAILEGRTIHIPDIADLDPAEWSKLIELSQRVGTRSFLAVPMMRENVAVGAIGLRRLETGRFSDKQINLLESFAAQAVIAIENVRLFTELRESLDQQTATADILRVISQSPTDVQPVLNVVVKAAQRFCGADDVVISLRHDDELAIAAHDGPIEAPPPRRRLDRSTAQGRAVIDARTIHLPDISQVDPAEWSTVIALSQRHGAMASLAAPMLRDGAAVGAIMLRRREAGPFTEPQMALLEAFAAQAVIAIENVRLFTELQQRTDDLTESLDYQTATSEVLAVISRSPADLQPVLEAMTAAAVRLCGVKTGGLSVRRGETLQFVALVGQTPEFERWQMRAPLPIERGILIAHAVLDKEPVQIVDVMETDAYKAGAEGARAIVDLGGHRTILHVPLLRDDEAVGVLTVSRSEPQAFTERQIGLIKTFADQAVIAMENARLLSELRESLDQQTATAEILQVINASPGNLTPVFQTILEKAHCTCGADMGSLFEWDGIHVRAVATLGYDPEIDEILREPHAMMPAMDDLISGQRFFHRVYEQDRVNEGPHPFGPRFLAGSRIRTNLIIPLRKDDAVLGFISANRRVVRPYSDKEIALLENFAAQAVIAMENARLLGELRESLDKQTAMAEVLQVISASPGEVEPVFDAILESATRICGAQFGALGLRTAQGFEFASGCNLPPPYSEWLRANPMLSIPGGAAERMAATLDAIQSTDLTKDDSEAARHPQRRALVDIGGARTMLWVPMVKGEEAVGIIAIYRTEVAPFSEQQIDLVKNFASQAVIAMENARLLSELTRREEELRVTFDHMGDGVVMFDADLKLASWNRNFQELLDIPDAFLTGRPDLEDYVRLLLGRGELGAGDADREVARYRERANETWSAERTRPDGRIVEVRNNPVPGGGAVLIYSDITERKKAETEIAAARDAAEAALIQLKGLQANLIQSEKMASLGQLTAGIAHEIKNPLNFVNNFAMLSVGLLEELKEVAGPALATLDEDKRAELDETMGLLVGNLEKINEHGKRADGIVKSMLSHSRGGTGDWQQSDINALVEEALNLAYHGARAQDKEFNVTLERELDKTGKPIEVVPQDVTRVFLNLFGNGFYAANKRRLANKAAGFKPTLKVTTRDLGDSVEVRVRDNGIGMPPAVREKLFQPFFTTKPTGEGTGLGLSISYDIVTQQHGGTIEVESEPDNFTEFTVRLPRSRRVAAVEKIR